MEGTVQQVTPMNPTPVVPVMEVPFNADSCLEYGVQQLCLRRTLMILLKSFSLNVLTTHKGSLTLAALTDQQQYSRCCLRQRMMVMRWKRVYMDDLLDCFCGCQTDGM